MTALRLVISDVDGTLVTHAKELTDGTVAAVRRLEAAGVPFTLISARPPSGILPLIARLGTRGPFAAFNGGIVANADGTIVERHAVDPEVVRGCFALAEGSGATPWIFAAGRWFLIDPANPHVPRERLSAFQEPVVREDLSDLFGAVDKLTWVSDEPERLADLERRAIAAFGERATIARSQTYYLDVTAPAANKGNGVAALAAAAGVPLAETAVLGDMPNDLPMFARAGLSIAMGQAPAEVRDRAGEVTTSNEEDGVAHAIDTIILPRQQGEQR
jgi:Cof subfamily protein (haloacid dehalogenase superfamily)